MVKIQILILAISTSLTGICTIIPSLSISAILIISAFSGPFNFLTQLLVHSLERTILSTSLSFTVTLSLLLFHCSPSLFLSSHSSFCLSLFVHLHSFIYRLPLILLPCYSYLSPLSGSLIDTLSLKPSSLSLLSLFIALSILGSLANHCFFYLLTHWRRT